LGRKTPQGQLLGSNFCPRGGLGPDFFSVFFNGSHDVSDDEVGEICYVTCFWLIFFKISKAWGAWWHRTASLLLRGCRVVASFQKPSAKIVFTGDLQLSPISLPLQVKSTKWR